MQLYTYYLEMEDGSKHALAWPDSRPDFWKEWKRSVGAIPTWQGLEQFQEVEKRPWSVLALWEGE